MAYEGPRMVISDESVNTYGTRVINAGFSNRKDWEKNPIMLYNHNEAWRGQTTEMLPIGYWKDLKFEDGKITAIPVVDDEDESTGKLVAGKMQRKVLRSASIGIRIIETSKDPKHMLKGQTRPTIIKWSMREVSIVDIPSNKNAVVFYDDNGNCINLSDKSHSELLPKLQLSDSRKSFPTMNELQIIAGFLNLKVDATLADVQSEIMNLRTKADQKDALVKQLKDLQEKEDLRLKENATALLEQAVKDGKIREDQKAHYKGFADKDPAGFEALVGAMVVQQNLSDVPRKSGDKGSPSGELKFEGKTFDEIHRLKDDGVTMQRWKENDLAGFKEAFKAKYGKDYKS